MNTITNGYSPIFAETVSDSSRAAERAVVAGAAFRLNALDEQQLKVELFEDPAYRVLFIALRVFKLQNPREEQAAASRLIPFIRSTPELCGLFSDEVLPLEAVPELLSTGNFDIDYIRSHVETLRHAEFERDRRKKLTELERLPKDRFLRELKQWLPELEDTGTAAEYNVVTAHELATNDYPLEYMIPGLLVQGQPAVIGGGKKSLKTTLLVDLMLSLASKSKFLNEFYVTRRYRVGLMSGESGAATIKETAERIAKSKPWVNLSDYTDLVFSFELPKLGKHDTAENLIRFIKSHSLEVLGIDPLYLAMQAGDGASNLYSMGDKLLPLAEVIAETGCTIILAHHARKIAKSDFARFSPPELDDLAFAGISEFARQWLLLNRREEYNPEAGGHHELWLAAGGSAGHSGLWALSVDEGTRLTPGGRFWQVTVSKASEARKEQAQERETIKADRDKEKQARDEQRLLEAYKQFPDGETANTIKISAGMNAVRFGSLNWSLLQRKLVVPCRVSKNGCEYDGFRLRSDNSDNSDKNGICPTGLSVEGVRSDKSPSLEGTVRPTDPPLLDLAETDEVQNPAICPTVTTPKGKRKSAKKKPAGTRKAGA